MMKFSSLFFFVRAPQITFRKIKKGIPRNRAVVVLSLRNPRLVSLSLLVVFTTEKDRFKQKRKNKKN